jgi:uncharacterized protein (DUF2147 family)
MLALAALTAGSARAAVSQGVWLLDGKAAVQIFPCGGLMCGRIEWLQVPRNAQGQLDRDRRNPDPALRQRQLCGLRTIWDMHPDGPNRWRDGWFYNPDDGATYRLSAELKHDNVLVARVYVGVPLLGKTKTLVRVARGVSGGWC